MNVMIVGGGIGGLTTALALQQRDIEAHVYEATAELKPVGKGIWLPTNAMLILDKLALGDTVATKGIALERIELCDKQGDTLQAIDLKSVRQRLGRTTTSILRTDLQASLAAALASNTLHLGRRCIGVTQDDNSATIHFDDGSRITGDVIIGADGIRSRVREAIVPNVKLRFSGQSCYLGVANVALPTNALRTVREIWGGTARMGYSAVGPEQVYWFAPQKAAANGATPQDIRATLRTIYATFPQPIPELIEQTPTDEIMHVYLNDFLPIKEWYKGRIVLLGDAAHAMTPNLGQGGAQAIEDAYVLAQALDKCDSPTIAFEQYQRIRQPKAQRIAATAWRLGQMAHLTNPVLRRLRNIGFQLTPESIKQRQVEAIYRLNF